MDFYEKVMFELNLNSLNEREEDHSKQKKLSLERFPDKSSDHRYMLQGRGKKLTFLDVLYVTGIKLGF